MMIIMMNIQNMTDSSVELDGDDNSDHEMNADDDSSGHRVLTKFQEQNSLIFP